MCPQISRWRPAGLGPQCPQSRHQDSALAVRGGEPLGLRYGLKSLLTSLLQSVHTDLALGAVHLALLRLTCGTPLAFIARV